jgi:hypothetical protein
VDIDNGGAVACHSDIPAFLVYSVLRSDPLGFSGKPGIEFEMDGRLGTGNSRPVPPGIMLLAC